MTSHIQKIPFCTFVIQQWHDTDIQKYILHAQATHGTVAIAILWCMWHDSHHSPLPLGIIKRMIRITDNTNRRYIVPIRNKRIRTSQTSALYKSLLRREIFLEMTLGHALTRTLPHPKPQALSPPRGYKQRYWGNLETYCTLVGISDFYMKKGD